MPYFTPLEWAALYTAANILILLGLAIGVVRARISQKVVLGDGDNPVVLRAVRAHGNAAEYVPAGLIALVMLGLMQPAAPVWTVHVVGGALTLGRLLHGIGLSMGERNIGRSLGTLLTWISLLVGAFALVAAAHAQSL